jgi:aryl carrier-like protein
VGVPGPIWIGGAGVATGYLHDPARTEAVFVEASIGDRPERLFATADVGRYLPTGEVEFLGRSDRMLKIRGFRVEPGEIEAALERRADVRRALVGGVEAEDGDVRLVAYVVPSADPVPDPVLRSFLRAALPAHLVPSEIAQVAEVPMLGNGKPDFKAIMARSSKGSDPRTASPGPAASSEGTALGRMAGIWSQLLGSGPLDADDDFFECGGHSILAMRLAARIRKGFGVSLTLEEIFDHPRLRQLATMVDQRATERPGASRGS